MLKTRLRPLHPLRAIRLASADRHRLNLPFTTLYQLPPGKVPLPANRGEKCGRGFTAESGCASNVLVFQPDLFDRPVVKPAHHDPCQARRAELDLPALLDRLTLASERPRYSFMVLTLIDRVADATGVAGPWVQTEEGAVPIRDWLTDALICVARRDPRRMAITNQVRRDLERRQELPDHPFAAEAVLQEGVRARLRVSGRTNISRAVSDLVRAGLVHRHYQGYRVDHANRGAQRHAVYTILPEARRALARANHA